MRARAIATKAATEVRRRGMSSREAISACARTLHTDPERWWDAPATHRRGMRDRTDPVYWPLGDSAS